MNLSRISLLVTILFVFVASVFAQQKSYEIITHKDELFGKPISGIMFDSDGKLWMGGMGEVSRLDGETWTTFTADEEISDGISDSTFSISAIGPDGVLWCRVFITTYPFYTPVVRFDGETWTSFTLDHEGIKLPISAIAVGPDGTAWAGTSKGVVFYYNDNTWTKTTLDFKLGNAIRVNDLAVDTDGTVYAATNGGIYMYTDRKWINTGPEWMDPNYPSNSAYAVTVGPDGIVWIGTMRGNVSCFDGESWTTIVKSNDITQRFENAKSRLIYWIINQEKEYFKQHGEYVNFEFGEDCEPIGYNAYYREESSYFKYSFHDSIATALENLDANGDGDTADGFTLSVTGIKGIIPGSDVTWETIFGEGPSGYWITGMAVGSYGEIWLDTYYGPLFLYDNVTWIQYTEEDFLDDGPIWLIGIAPDDAIWIRTGNGVAQLIPTPTSVEMEKSIPSDFAITGNYPNPFNPTTTIEFTIPETGLINLSIYNISGQKIHELVADTMTAGTHSVTWDGRDENGMMVSSGIYISSLKSGEHMTARRMLLMK